MTEVDLSLLVRTNLVNHLNLLIQIIYLDTEGKTIKATQGGDINPSRDIKRYAKLHKSTYLDLDNIITHRFTFDEI